MKTLILVLFGFISLTIASPIKDDPCPIDSCVHCKDVRTCAKCKPGFYKQFSPYGQRTLCRANCGIFLYPSKNEKGELFCTKKPTRPCPITDCERCTTLPQTCAKCKPGYYKYPFFFDNKRTICTSICGEVLQPSKDDKGELVCVKKTKTQICQDLKTSCVSWNQYGYCKSSSLYFSYMKKHCMRSCGLCHVSDEDDKEDEDHNHHHNHDEDE